MSIRVMSLVWDSELDSAKKMVLLYYADRGSDEGENIFPSIATVAKKTGYSERSVQRITRCLVIENLLIPVGISALNTNAYRINIPAVMAYENLKKTGGDKLAPVTALKMDEMSPGGVTFTPQKGDTASPNTSLTTSINHQITLQEAPVTTEENSKPTTKKVDWVDCVLKFSQQENGPDVSQYPEDVQGVLRAFALCFEVDVPRKIGGKRGEYAAWINEGRMLVDACREYGEAAIREARDVEFEKFKFTVGRPRAILSIVRAAVARMRGEQKTAHRRFDLGTIANNPLTEYDPAKVEAFQNALDSRKAERKQND